MRRGLDKHFIMWQSIILCWCHFSILARFSKNGVWFCTIIYMIFIGTMKGFWTSYSESTCTIRPKKFSVMQYHLVWHKLILKCSCGIFKSLLLRSLSHMNTNQNKKNHVYWWLWHFLIYTSMQNVILKCYKKLISMWELSLTCVLH
jgi:hypothetical protein